MEKNYYHVYVANISKGMTKQEMFGFLGYCYNRSAAPVSGVIVETNGTVFHFMEGEKKEVQRAYSLIRSFSIHSKIIELISGEYTYTRSKEMYNEIYSIRSGITNGESEGIQKLNDLSKTRILNCKHPAGLMLKGFLRVNYPHDIILQSIFSETIMVQTYGNLLSNAGYSLTVNDRLNSME
jgi:hypothetical protein